MLLVKRESVLQQTRFLSDRFGLLARVLRFRGSDVQLRTVLVLGCLLFLFCGTGVCDGSEPDIRRDAAVNAIEKVMPCVVNIATETVIEYHEWYDEMLRQFYGWPHGPSRQQKSVSLGSGVIIDEDGYVYVTGRVKDIFKTLKGKYVAPAPIEGAMARNGHIDRSRCATEPRPAVRDAAFPRRHRCRPLLRRTRGQSQTARRTAWRRR